MNKLIVESAETCRIELAARRDSLVMRQRRGYSPARQKVIDRLGDQYRQAVCVAIEHGRNDNGN